MRALHLIGMRAARGGKLRFHPVDDAPLVLPAWIPASDREILLAFYQQVLADELLPRIEVDWYRSLVPADRGFLRNTSARHGSGEHLVVVKVRGEGADLREILAQPELQPFQHIAVASDQELAGETLGRLGELTRFVTLTTEEIYEEMVGELSLRADGNTLVEPLVRTLLNPILVVETYNALVDVHAEGVAPEEQRNAVFRRILGRLLDDTPPHLVVALAALVLRGSAGLEEAVREPQRIRALAELRARMLVRDGRPVRWAELLQGVEMRDAVGERLRGIVQPRGALPKGAQTVLGWLDDGGRPGRNPIGARVLAVFPLLNEGQIGRARDELSALERELESPAVTDKTRGNFWDAVGRLRAAEGRWDEAEPAFRRALDLLERGNAPAAHRGIATDQLARSFRDNGRWKEAEPLFREALRLRAEGKATPVAVGITMDHLARGLRDNDRWEEAEPLFRNALRLKTEGRDHPIGRAVTMFELALGLRIVGREDEAGPLLAEARRLMEEPGAEPPATRAGRLRNYARKLHHASRASEAAEIEALAAKIEKAGVEKAD